MKTSFTSLIVALISFSVFAADSTVTVSPNPVLENTIIITVNDQAAEEISNHLSDNGVQFERDHIGSGALVQTGERIKCIKALRNKPLHCVVSVKGAKVY